MSTQPVTPIRRPQPTPGPSMDLGVRVRDVCRALPGGSTQDICRAVWETLIPQEMVAALRQALPVFVEQYRAGNRPPDPASGRNDPKPAAPARSWKTDAAKRYATEWLNRRIDATGDCDFKALGDCNAVELRGFAERQTHRAVGILSDAHWVRNLADQLELSGAATLAELPAEALKTLEVVP